MKETEFASERSRTLKISQVAERLQIGQDGVYSLIHAGLLTASDIRRPGSKIARWRVTEDELNRYLRQQEFKKPEPRRKRTTRVDKSANYFDEHGRPTR